MTGRYAPSPTGELHLGNLRTALAAWLFARSESSGFVLRIDDLDPQRSRREHERSQLADLRALGLDWDGEPLRQSGRAGHYREAFEWLRTQGRVYPCWCTRAEIREAVSAPHGDAPEGAYAGVCRGLTASERSARERERGAPRAWRLDARGERVGFVDRVYGAVERDVDDFVLWRGDDAVRAGAGGAAGKGRDRGGGGGALGGVAAYNLAVVVDDAAQGVEEVVRGEDLLAGSPRQLLLARLLGVRAPRYAHVPLVLGPDGRRLAKRDGAVTLAERLARGESVERVVGWMAHGLGLLASGEQVDAHGLLERFDPARIAREATVLDPEGTL